MSSTRLPPSAPRSRRARYTLLAAAITALLSACGGGADSPAAPSNPPPPAPTLAITAAPAIVTVEQGQTAVTTVTVARGGHNAAVSLAAGGATGIATTLEPATLPSDLSASVVTLVTTPTTPTGDHAVTITGAGGGANANATIVLRVTPAPAPPVGRFTLAVTPSPLAVVAGGATTFATIAIARTDFTGNVTFGAAGAPAGMTIMLANGPIAGPAATIGVQAAASVGAGDYAITLTGVADGLAPVSTVVVVRVAAAPPPTPTPTPTPDDLTGVALDSRGQPLANVMVQVKMVWNPNVVRTRTGADGRYAVRGLPAGLSHLVQAWHEVEYAGRSYCVRLGMPNTGDYDAFVPGPGVVRDFRWKLTGRIPDAGNNYFGATLVLVASSDFYNPVLENGDDVEVALVPQGPLVDGSAGEVITRTVRYNSAGWNSRLTDIPHGVYTARATRVRGGVRTALRVARLENGTPSETATVEWEPDHPGSCGQVLGPDLRAFSLRLENP